MIWGWRLVLWAALVLFGTRLWADYPAPPWHVWWFCGVAGMAGVFGIDDCKQRKAKNDRT